MQIVIELNEELYDYMKSLPYNTILEMIVLNGTPLPKGHGKLVDVEDVKNNIRKWRGYLDEDMMYRINFAIEHHIPTIIEADNKESD